MSWVTLRALSRTKTFTASVVVLIGIPLLAHGVGIARGTFPGLAFPPSLKLLFASSLSLLFAAVTFHIGCPALLKRYEAVSDYIAHELPLLERSDPEHQAEIILANIDATNEGTKQELAQLRAKALAKPPTLSHAEQTRLEALVGNHFSSAVQAYMVNSWERQNKSRVALRLLTSFFYAVGAALAMPAFIERVTAVFRA